MLQKKLHLHVNYIHIIISVGASGSFRTNTDILCLTTWHQSKSGKSILFGFSKVDAMQL